MAPDRSSPPPLNADLDAPTTSHTLYSRPTTYDYGFTALPADMSQEQQQPDHSSTPPPDFNAATDLKVPQSPLAQRIQAYAKSKLPRETFNHSQRVYAYGLAVARGRFEEWEVVEGGSVEETW